MRPLAAHISSFSKVFSSPFRLIFVRSLKTYPKLATLLLTASVLGAGLPAIAQNAQPPNVPVRQNDGSVNVDNNARNIRTGPLINTSTIPLPASLPVDTQEGVSIPVDRTRLAPNTIQIRPDLPYIRENFNRIVNSQPPGSNFQYTFQRETLEIRTTFDLLYRQGNHSFGEGIQVRVLDATGNQKSTQTIFVKGDRVTRGPNGELLPTSGSIEAIYGADDVVELRVLNLRGNGRPPSDSAIYFTSDFKSTDVITGQETIGEFIVEDFQDGGDVDFDDGEYVQAPRGEGSARAREELGTLTVTTRVEPVALDPFINEVVVEEQKLVEGDTQTNVEEIELARARGQVEVKTFVPSILLGHATGVRTENGEQLLYNRYANASEARLGSDGLSVTGQLSPLIKNPSAPPTLLTGNLRFDPFVDDNEAGLVAKLGLTQFLTRTHRPARDVFGNEIVGPDDTRLLEPKGLLRNRRLVGYVPTNISNPEPGEQIRSLGGIFELPSDQAVTIARPDPQRVGRGRSAYTDNVGGVIIERADGSLTFVPQWTNAGYAQSPTPLAAGEATRIIYALVPQQAGQNLQLGQTYAVTAGAAEYLIADGGFKIISANRQPQNFVEETAEVYAVEDTVAAEQNAVTNLFNGIPGVYVQAPGGAPVATVDVANAAEVDARVGNDLYSLTAFQEDGQPAYARTTRAGGLYLSGGLTGGFGNQKDTVLLSRQTTEFALDQLRNTRTTSTFSTPRSRVDTIDTETGTVTQRNGIASFEINEAGELENAVFTSTETPTVVSVNNRETRLQGAVELGAREQIGSSTEEDVISETTREISRDEESITRDDSYPNFSAVSGEAAFGGAYNFGNTPWTTAANTVRAELFYRDTVFGRSSNDSETGVRAELVFHPFGEVKRDAYRYDEAGNVVPVYQTESMLDAQGNRMFETLSGANDQSVELAVNQFALDGAGDRIQQRIGTGKAKGPGAYLRAENLFNGGDGVEIEGGLQISF
ncbi:MAG: hypothetical protein WA947_19845 [Phormidesmis sp.]